MSIYLDNAATSWPKPKEVYRAMKESLVKGGGNPGRSGHGKSIAAGRTVLAARESIAEFFSINDPAKIIFTKNATEALNIALFGSLQPGDHVVTTSMEHNSVLRPVSVLQKRGVEVTIVNGNDEGRVDPAAVGGSIKDNTKLVCMTHASNVTGTIQQIDQAAAVCKAKKVPLLIDAAQSAGVVPINCEELGIDFLAASGHKGLLGPQGTGFLYVKNEPPTPLMYGGTGSLSDSEEQPGFFPDVLESGTLNAVGIAGLMAGVEYLNRRGIDEIRSHELSLLNQFLSELRMMPELSVYGPEDVHSRTGAVSILSEKISSSKFGEELDVQYGIQTRIGLHCAPRAHKTIGTFPHGTVRFGMGPFTTEKEIKKVLSAIKEILMDR